MKDKKTWIAGGVMIAAAVVAGLIVRASSAEPAPAPYEPPAGTLSVVDARDALTRVPVLAPGQSFPVYDRDQFGKPWADVDGNHCDTRDDVLARDARAAGGLAAQPGGCKVTAIDFTEPYTGAHVTSTAQVDIDHVVPLAVAWRTGAHAWTTELRLHLANDPRNLLAVDKNANEHAKGDKTPDAWLPAARARCEYGRMYVTVLDVYKLPAAAATKATLADILGGC